MADLPLLTVNVCQDLAAELELLPDSIFHKLTIAAQIEPHKYWVRFCDFLKSQPMDGGGSATRLALVAMAARYLDQLPAEHQQVETA